jgi:tetratricopeptide (TPR) repeat protein
VARADRRRDARARPAPETGFHRKYESAYVGTEGLFFQRLRRQAKWIFVLLALTFAVSFVAFGVGSEVQGGIADALGLGTSGGAAGDQPSVGDARERLEQNPRDAEALRDLSSALQTEGNFEEAVDPLVRYTRIRPRDADALRELANLYLSRATRISTELNEAQVRAAQLNPAAEFTLPPDSPFAQAFSTNPFDQALSSVSSEEVNELNSRLTETYTDAQTTYERLARVTPQDESVQLDLADTAQRAGDAEAAIAAYEKFLELAPESPSAPLVEEQLKALKDQQAALSGAAGG